MISISTFIMISLLIAISFIILSVYISISSTTPLTQQTIFEPGTMLGIGYATLDSLEWSLTSRSLLFNQKDSQLKSYASKQY